MYNKSFLYFLYDMSEFNEVIESTGMGNSFTRHLFSPVTFETNFKLYNLILNNDSHIINVEQTKRNVGLAFFLELYTFWASLSENKRIIFVTPINLFGKVLENIQQLYSTLGRFYKMTSEFINPAQQIKLNNQSIIQFYSDTSLNMFSLRGVKNDYILFDSVSESNYNKFGTLFKENVKNAKIIINFSNQPPSMAADFSTTIKFIQI